MGKRADLEREVKALKRKLGRKGIELTTAKKAAAPKREPLKISDNVLAWARHGKTRIKDLTERIYQAAQPMPGVIPESRKDFTLANDANIKRSAQAAAIALDQQIVFSGGWAANSGYGGYGAFAEGQAFLGYPYLSELAQRPEYRVISETGATEMTRKGIKIKAKGSKGNKADRIQELEEEFKRLNVMELLCHSVEYDGYMGRSHLFLDFDDSVEDSDELLTPVGNGANEISQAKIKRGSFKRIVPVEAVWSYPSNYNSDNPLKPDWYNPQRWFAMGTEVHASRFLTFIGRKVPDMLKPAYSFGGLSMSQMAKPYVDNFLRTRQSVSDLLHAFTVWQLSTNLAETLTPGGDALFRRMEAFNTMRDNKGVILTDKETEEFANTSVPLSTLDTLQAQSQEMMCSVAKTPTVKLLGIDAQGLNASSEGTIHTYYDSIHATQPKLLGPNLDRIFKFAQINLWGAVDEDLSYDWVNLWSLDEKGEAEVRKIDADTDAVLVEIGAIDSEEVRERVAMDEDSPHASLDLNKVIEKPEDEMDAFGKPSISQGGGLGGNPMAQFKEAAE